MNHFELWDKVAWNSQCRLPQHFRLVVALWVGRLDWFLSHEDHWPLMVMSLAVHHSLLWDARWIWSTVHPIHVNGLKQCICVQLYYTWKNGMATDYMNAVLNLTDTSALQHLYVHELSFIVWSQIYHLYVLLIVSLVKLLNVAMWLADAHRALELLEDYHSQLTNTTERPLRSAIERVIRIFKSRLFQALLGTVVPVFALRHIACYDQFFDHIVYICLSYS